MFDIWLINDKFYYLGNILTKNMTGGLLLAGLGYIISMIISIFETLSKYSPIYLMTENLDLLTHSFCN